MQHSKLRFKKGFRVTLGNSRSQAAEMVLAPGDKEGGSDNRHRGADQWLFVVSGAGLARVSDKPYKLLAGTLMFIPRGERHEIVNNGRGLLRTLNVYVPPAYRKNGEPLPRGKK
jgi:mannose-6-phosphate isomerase-like protein (cupin superfamily)